MWYNIPDWLKWNFSYRWTNKSKYKKRFNKKPKLYKYMTMKDKFRFITNSFSNKRKIKILKKY